MIRDRQRFLLWLVFISLALNLFVGGVVVAMWLGQHPPDRLPHTPGAFMMGLGMPQDPGGSPPPEVSAIWTRREATLRAGMHDLHAAQQRVRDALRAEPWDDKELAAALTELRQRTGTAQLLWHQTLMELATTLPPAQRAQLGTSIRGMGMGRGRGMGRHANHPEP